jgi:dolichol-phosphate mannosyltransferase
MESSFSASHKPILSVVIPAYNEQDTIAGILERIRAVPLEKEIIVVDDASTDNTTKILEGLAASDLKVIRQPKNAGKGAAIRAGIPHATGEIVIIQDADAEYDPAEYPKLIAPILAGEAEVVYGSRFWTQESYQAGGKKKLLWPKGMQRANWLINRLLAGMANVLYKANITDEATCYKVFRAEVLQAIPLKCERFEFCPEVTAKVRRRGLRIKEIPITYCGRTSQEGKKIIGKTASKPSGRC